MGLIAGDYTGRPNGVVMRLGFFLSGDTYTDVVIPGAVNTYITALNNAGDFAGTAEFRSAPDVYQPYASIGGNVTVFSLSGSSTSVEGMNNLNQVVGEYFDDEGGHGYLRDADGTLIFPIDYPGARHTHLYGINDKGWMVGSYVDTESTFHGLFLSSPTDFISFDFSPSTFSSLYGINNQGIISGSYAQDFGIIYGAVARVTLSQGE